MDNLNKPDISKLAANAMRNQIPTTGSNVSDMMGGRSRRAGFSDMSDTMGGRRRRRRSHRRRRRGGIVLGGSVDDMDGDDADMMDGDDAGMDDADMMGGRRHRRSRGRRSRGRRSHRRGKGRSASRGRRARRAGSSCKTGGYAGLVKEAIVPFSLFALQNRNNSKKQNNKTFRKSRKSRY